MISGTSAHASPWRIHGASIPGAELELHGVLGHTMPHTKLSTILAQLLDLKTELETKVRMLALPIDIFARHVTQSNTVRPHGGAPGSPLTPCLFRMRRVNP